MSRELQRLARRNHLISCLPDKTVQAIVENSTSVALPNGYRLVGAGEKIEQIYFICSGIASILVVSRSGKMTESGLVGREGFVPSGVLVDADTSFNEIIMQISGEALVLDVDASRSLREKFPLFDDLMACAQYVLRTQVECTLLSNATQTVSQRLARWLLVCHDRIDGNQMSLTHEFLAIMLAVRRPSVTDALHLLEGNGFIRSERAKVTIRNRAALEDYAGEIYGLSEEENERIFSRFLPEPSLHVAMETSA